MPHRLLVCDHVEVLYDLDHEAAAVCREIGLTMVRAEAVNDDPRFLNAMAGAVMQTWNRYRVRHPGVIGAGVAINSRGRPAAVSIGASGWVAR